MLTRQLYYHDSYLRSFYAQAISVGENGLRVVLDQSAFYPSSGGQPNDLGTLNGIPVLDVVDEGDHLAHVLQSPLELGPVCGTIDWPRRFDHMQQHSGQHLLSAVAEEEFGLKTIGVHIGVATCTIDVEGAVPAGDWLQKLELHANERILSNRMIFTMFEDAATAEGLRKSSDRIGTLRVVTIEGLDRSACGGTHVRQSAEIGLLLVAKSEKIRQALRIEFRCGMRVLEELRRRGRRMEELQNGMVEADKAARKVVLELAALEGKTLYQSMLPDAAGRRFWQGNVEDFDEGIRSKAIAFLMGSGSVVLLFAPAKRSVLFAASPDLGFHCGKLLQSILAEVGGKGGGGPQMAQGNLPDVALFASIALRLLSLELPG